MAARSAALFQPGDSGRQFIPWIVAALLILSATGCSSVASNLPFAATETAQQKAENMEPMLQTAGFRELPAATAEQKQRIAALPPLKLGYYIDQNGQMNYWMADPQYCACLFHGDETAYNRYEQLKLDDVRASHDRQAMQSQRYAQPPMFGPPFGPTGPGFGGPAVGFGGPGIGFGGGFGGGGFGFSL